ncbi:MAG: AI-2E family transporter, partial [Polyangia bacterium]
MTAQPQQMDLRIPTLTIVKIALSLLVAWALLRLWPEFVLLLIGVVLAIALNPVVDWLDRKGLGRGTAILLIAVALVAMIVGFLTLMTTSLAEQISRLVSN